MRIMIPVLLPVTVSGIFWLIFSIPVQAWGPLGHQTICDIAWRSSTAAVRRQLSSAARRMGYRTFADSCTWPDEIRKQAKYDYLKPLHYMNVERQNTTTAQSACIQEEDRWVRQKAKVIYQWSHAQFPQCVVTAIPYYVSRLGDSGLSQRQRDEALLLIGHFIGDLHQPLHISYKDDWGGNRRRVVFNGKVLSLHQLWDTDILFCQYRGSWKKLGNQLYRKGLKGVEGVKGVKDTTILNTTVYQADITTPLLWANESLQITRKLYRKLPKRLPKSYCKQYFPLAAERLQQAGFRLGQLLGTALAPQ